MSERLVKMNKEHMKVLVEMHGCPEEEAINRAFAYGLGSTRKWVVGMPGTGKTFLSGRLDHVDADEIIAGAKWLDIPFDLDYQECYSPLLQALPLCVVSLIEMNVPAHETVVWAGIGSLKVLQIMLDQLYIVILNYRQHKRNLSKRGSLTFDDLVEMRALFRDSIFGDTRVFHSWHELMLSNEFNPNLEAASVVDYTVVAKGK